jgi:hypothetical protein
MVLVLNLPGDHAFAYQRTNRCLKAREVTAVHAAVEPPGSQFAFGASQ